MRALSSRSRELGASPAAEEEEAQCWARWGRRHGASLAGEGGAVPASLGKKAQCAMREPMSGKEAREAVAEEAQGRGGMHRAR